MINISFILIFPNIFSENIKIETLLQVRKMIMNYYCAKKQRNSFHAINIKNNKKGMKLEQKTPNIYFVVKDIIIMVLNFNIKL